MGVVSVKCPSCGANLNYDSKGDFGVCEYCGTRIMQDKIVVEHRVDESGKFDNFLNLANRAYLSENYDEAYSYYTKALEIRQDDGMIVFRKAICAGHLSESGKRNQEVIEGVRAAYACANPETKKKMSDEILNLVTKTEINRPSEFVGRESCETYVQSITGKSDLAYSLYNYIDTGDRETVSDYCKSAINICDMLQASYSYKKVNEGKKTDFNVDFSLSGISLRSNTSQEEPIVYNTSQSDISHVASVRKFFIDESNKFVNSEIENNKTLIDDAKREIKKLPVMLRVLHIAFSVPMVLAAVTLAVFVHPVPGLILLAAETACFIVYLKMDSDRQAQNAYACLRQRNTELYKNKKQIKH